MPPTENYPRGLLYQSVIEWRIEGPLDGLTPAPGLVSSGNVVRQAPSPPELPFVIKVDGAAGLFDPDADGGRAAYGDRYIEWIRVVPATFPVPASFELLVVDASGVVPAVADPIPVARLRAGAFGPPAEYIAALDFVPQGFVIAISGIGAAPPGSFHTVTMGVRAAMVTYEDAQLDLNSCCLFDPG